MPSVPKSSRAIRVRAGCSALGELRPLPGLLQSCLLPLLDARVAGQEAATLKLAPEAGVGFDLPLGLGRRLGLGVEVPLLLGDEYGLKIRSGNLRLLPGGRLELLLGRLLLGATASCPSRLSHGLGLGRLVRLGRSLASGCV